jgi:hypothetical protein
MTFVSITNNLDVVIFDGTNKSGLTWVRVSKNPDRARYERGPLNLTGLADADVADENFSSSQNLHAFLLALSIERKKKLSYFLSNGFSDSISDIKLLPVS